MGEVFDVLDLGHFDGLCGGRGVLLLRGQGLDSEFVEF